MVFLLLGCSFGCLFVCLLVCLLCQGSVLWPEKASERVRTKAVNMHQPQIKHDLTYGCGSKPKIPF